MVKSFRYRIYPTKKQLAVLDRQLDLCRWLYNAALEERIHAWTMRKKGLTFADQSAELPDLKREFPEFQELYAQAAQSTLRRLDGAYQRFFKLGGFPRFKSKNRFRSFLYPQDGFAIKNGKLKVSKVGSLRIKLHRPLEGEIKTLRLLREADGKWYATFACDLGDSSVPARPVDAAVGLDLGVEKFATLSDGSMIPNPRHTKENAEVKAKRQQRLAVKQRGSKNREKARKLVAKSALKERNQRRDFHFKLANHLLKHYDQIVVEDLSIGRMTRSARGTVEEPGSNVAQKAGLNREILSAGWGQFLEILRFKAENAGVQILTVDPRGTSQTCSSCGDKVRKDLSERLHRCDCGLEIDRDWNAALNILRLGTSRPKAKARREACDFSRG